MGGIDKRLLVTGCGRSGTKYTAALLQKLGLDVRHEEMGADGIATWCMAVDSDDSPWGGGRRGIRFGATLHQVRHPLSVIPSLTTFTAPSWDYIARFVPCKPDQPMIVRAAEYWYHWNIEAERTATWRFRIEKLPNVFREFCNRAGVRPDPEALRTTSTLVHSRKTRPWLRWARWVLDYTGIGQSTRKLDFMYNRDASYVGGPFTWEALEQHAPGWAKPIQEMAIRYGYTVADDMVAAGLTSDRGQTRRGRRRPTRVTRTCLPRPTRAAPCSCNPAACNSGRRHLGQVLRGRCPRAGSRDPRERGSPPPRASPIAAGRSARPAR